MAFKSYGLKREYLARDLMLQLLGTVKVVDRILDSDKNDDGFTFNSYLVDVVVDLADKLVFRLACNKPSDVTRDQDGEEDSIFNNELSPIVLDSDLGYGDNV